MKTTVEIADPLLREARKLAEREGVTLRILVERGLQRVVSEARRPAFRLRKASFKGVGLQRDMQDADWNRVRDMAYEGRGG